MQHPTACCAELAEQWMHECRLHGEMAATAVRDSAAAVQGELLACYALIAKLGRCARP